MTHTSLSDILTTPLTNALRRALETSEDSGIAQDLLFLERWELHPDPTPADTLRAAQLRRANPELAAAIRAELKRKKT